MVLDDRAARFLVAPYAIGAWFGNGFDVLGAPVPGTVAVNQDGSEVAYVPSCAPRSQSTAALVQTTVALAPTNGSGAPLTATLAPPPTDAKVLLNGATVTLSESFTDDGGVGVGQPVFAGNPLAQTIPSLSPYAVTDPTGKWAWEPASAGMQLVRISDGSVVFTDPDAASDGEGSPRTSKFDASGANLFYASTEGLKQIALASPTTAITIPGTSAACAAALVTTPANPGRILTAPNGEAVLCITSLADGGSPDNVTLVTTGATPSIVALPWQGLPSYAFLPDSTLTWPVGGTLFAEPVSGGPVVTVATSISGDTSIGGSQVVTFGGSTRRSANAVVDAAGKSPGFQLNPSPDVTVVFAPTSGGVVAYAAGGSIYAVKTN